MPPASEIIACPHCGGSIETAAEGIGVDLICPLCHQPFLHRAQVAQYRLERKIGSGGMATVFLAADPARKEPVAIKVLRRKFSDNARFIQAFENEAKITASLSHPHIVQVFGAGSWEGQEYLVMEHLAGGSLQDRIATGRPLAETEALEIGSAVLSALQLAASRGLIHRDIKPANLLRGTDGVWKLADFGLCLAITAQETETCEVWGSPACLPPERLEREPEDQRSDIYGLGATLFYGLAGRPPYLEQDPAKIVACHRAGPPPGLREVAPEVSEAMAHLVDRALRKRPEERFATYQELLGEIDRLRKGSRPLESDVEMGQPWPLWKRGAAFLLFAGGTAALMLWIFWKAVFPA